MSIWWLVNAKKKDKVHLSHQLVQYLMWVLGTGVDLWCCSAVALSNDHKPNRTDERQRIEDAGGVVMWSGKISLRVNNIHAGC